MLIKIASAAVLGMETYPVAVEVDKQKGLPGQSIVGLPDAAVRESRDRVRAAIENSGFMFPDGYFTFNLAPADTKKEGSLYDLPMALGMLIVSEQITPKKIEALTIVGELSLDGTVRPVNGVLSICLALQKQSGQKVLVPKENADEAALAQALEILPVASLREAADYIAGQLEIPVHKVDLESLLNNPSASGLDFADVKGQQHVKRALEVAAAGGHNILLVGSPGSGKTMLARRLPDILPSLALDEALEITQLYSASGLLGSKGTLINKRPFRSPHHTTSDIGIIGGGRIPRPGEVSLSHHGVLFLDEFPEFDRNVLEVLRQPLEDGEVTISRAHSSLTYPAQFMLVAAMNPCPCGRLYDLQGACSCNAFQIQRYWKKLSEPLLDRIDIQLEVARLKSDELVKLPTGEKSIVVRQRVEAAKQRQRHRFKGRKTFANARMLPGQLKEFCSLENEAENLLKTAIAHLRLSGRAYDKILKLSRTIADLDGKDKILAAHIAEAIQYRALDRRAQQSML